MSRITTVLIADSQSSGRAELSREGLSRHRTLVVSHPDNLRGAILERDVRVVSVAKRMSDSVRAEIEANLRFAQELSGPSAADVAERVVTAVTARLDTAHHEWLPAATIAHAVLAELVGVAEKTLSGTLKRGFLAQIRDLVAATLPHNVAEPAEPSDTVVRIGPRYGTVLLVDALVYGPPLMEALSLRADSTLVVSLPSHLDGVELLDDVEVMDRTVTMPAMCRADIDAQLERCKQGGRR